MIRRIAVVLLCLVTTPAMAEVTHRMEGRFGVGYTSDPAPGQPFAQPMYEGRYTMGIAHRADNGMIFRFELGVAVGNLPDRGDWRGPSAPNARAGATLGLDLNLD